MSDFERFKSELKSEFTAKKQDTSEAAHRDLAVFKHNLTIKLNVWKENATIAADKDIALAAKSSVRQGRKAKRTDPIYKASQSVSHT